MTKKCLIIGGVAGGATTAARLRRNDENAKIIMFERGSYISYANCGLPYYIGGEIKDREDLFVQTPEDFSKRFNVDVRVDNEVLSIDRKTKSIKVKNLKTDEEYEEKYDKLILSPGAEPLKPRIPGIDDKRIFTLRNVPDTDKIKNFVDEHKPKRAIIVGAGFIGLEMAENLHNLGVFTTIIEMADQVMSPLDYEMAAEVHQHLKIKGVELYLGDGVKSFEGNNDSLSVNLQSGKNLKADIVILSIGVKPESKLAEQAGLTIGENGGIVVDKYLRTNDPDIYAVGDAIEYKNPITGKSQITYLAGPANKQGRIVADNIALNKEREYKGSINTAIAKVFDITVAATGASEKILKENNIPYNCSITHSSSHAGYYPGAMPMSIKLIFSEDNGKVLGAQIVGYEGVDKRIDLFATILKNNGTIYDLEEIEHAYAPPFSSAKDPANIAGFAAENIVEGRVKTIRWSDIEKISPDKYTIVDVRTDEEFALGHIEGATNISVDEIRNRLSEIDKNKNIIVYCAVGLRGYIASRILSQNSFKNVFNLTGGYKTWEMAVQKQSNEDIFSNDHIAKDNMIYNNPEPKSQKSTNITTLKIDACGLQCPGPIMKLKKSIDDIKSGERLEIISTDMGFLTDSESWCKVTGNKLVSKSVDKGKITAIIEKQHKKQEVATSSKDDKTMVVFSDDLDRALASFIIANGAASLGKKVTMFFTFWGLNIIKKESKPSISKDLMAKMFGWMMPKSSKNLSLSKMNMGGLGTNLMKMRMKNKNVDTLEELIQKAVENGVEFIACQMSMDVMGIKKEELLDSVKIGGVANYLEKAEDSNVNLFI